MVKIEINRADVNFFPDPYNPKREKDLKEILIAKGIITAEDLK